MAGIVLDVDPSDFLVSSRRASAATRAITSACESLRSGLADSSRMAGSDPTGAKWAAQYDSVVADAVRSLDSLECAFGQIAAGLSVTGLNYATADWLSSGQVGHAPGFAVPSLRVGACSAAPPSAAGGSRTPDIPGWELVASFVGDMWPDGDPTRLRHAHSQWSTLADRLDTVHHRDVPGILAALDSIRTPELPAIHSTLTTVSTAVSNLSQEARNLGAADGELADQIDEVHRQTAEVVAELVVELGATVLIGAGLTVVTAGLSDAAAAGVGAAKVATAVGRIVRFVGDLAAAGDRIIASVARSAVTVGGVARIPERITIRIVTIAGKSVVTGTGGAATNVGITAMTGPGADLDDAAVQGFVVGAGLGALGATARLAGATAVERGLGTARAVAAATRPAATLKDIAMPGTTKTLPGQVFADSYARSRHNMSASVVMLGKYDGGGPSSYITRAGTDHAYFDMGLEYDRIRDAYDLTPKNMFDAYNAPFLDDGIAQRKSFHFSHDPHQFPGSALETELLYLTDHGYVFNRAKMVATPRK